MAPSPDETYPRLTDALRAQLSKQRVEVEVRIGPRDLFTRGDAQQAGGHASPDRVLDRRELPDRIVIDDGATDIVAEGYDAGVRLGEVVVQDMVAIRVSPDQRQLVVGAPANFGRHGKPKHPRDLHAHACIGWRHISASTPHRWEFSDKGKEFEVSIEARVNTTDMGLMTRLAVAGVGVTIGLEDTFVPYLRRRQLVSVLEPYCEQFPGFFLYYPKRPQTPLKLKALADFLRRRSKMPARP